MYTRPAPKSGSASGPNPTPTPKQSLSTVSETANDQQTTPPPAKPHAGDTKFASPSSVASRPATASTPVSSSFVSDAGTDSSAAPAPNVPSKAPSLPSLGGLGGFGGMGRLNASQDSHVLNETLNVINEHITDLNSPQLNDSLRMGTNDSESEYSSHLDARMSYIQGEETDEEEEGAHTRAEILAWTADDVAEYLFTSGVEKHHCEVFRDQEITGEVLLGMDQTSLFIKAFDLGPVGRRLKTWQKIKALQDEVNGEPTRRTTQTYGSDAGSDIPAGRIRSRTSTLSNSANKLPQHDDRPTSVQTKRQSLTRTPKMEPAQPPTPVSPLVDSPTRRFHEKRPSAASVRELHHSRRHSSTDFRLTGTTLDTSVTAPKLAVSGSFAPPSDPAAHKKQPSFDRNWTLRSATTFPQRPLSSAGFHQDGGGLTTPDAETHDSAAAADPDRGYFSGTDAESRRRNVLRKRESDQPVHSRKSSYAEEQRVRTATALSRHSRFGSVDSVRDPQSAVSATQKYYGLGATPHRRTASTATTESVRPIPPAKDGPAPTVTILDGPGPKVLQSSPISPISPLNRQAMHTDWYSKTGIKGGFGLRAISDAVTGSERSKLSSSVDSSHKESPIQSPSRTGSSTPSAGPSLDLDSIDASKGISPAAAAGAPRNNNARKKNKKETSAYLRGLQKTTPREAIQDADYSGWMKKKSSNLMTTWKPRLFVLKGRRLAYYYSENDDQEKGLIDISFHRVLPADNEKLTGLHATLTGASNTPTMPAGSHVPTLAAAQAKLDPTKDSDSIFIFKLVPPRTGLSRAVNFTKPTVHYFAVPNIKQGRLWMAALMKATIDRDDAQAITTTYQQKTISLARARAMRHRPPNLMNLDEAVEESLGDENEEEAEKKETNGLGIVYDGADSGVSGLEKLGLQKVESARSRGFGDLDLERDAQLPQSA